VLANNEIIPDNFIKKINILKAKPDEIKPIPRDAVKNLCPSGN
jgi:hypothetical protein